ncbi:hypothetical protein CCHL11_02312 [Colletotrichum chlorophyti]|uniref:Transcription factor domain-containing protein n=1 Tax=Colletotrichum chlorophyti TaxID=708187 RepID=A0A1Q8S668_9PEZI|nr:hypothetical protein CCHL11_02312 [Colletotrichum chlorophyti]
MGYRPLLIKPAYESLIFTQQLEKDQFEYWMAFSKESSLFPSDLMSELLPQIAREDPAIKYAAFAVGAATLGSPTRRQRVSGTGPYMADALRHYGRSINLVRSSEPSKKSVPRALLACLLFVTFEAVQGNHKAALTHLNFGCKILDQLMRQGVSGDCPPRLIDEVISSFQRFTLLSWTVNDYHPPETEAHVPWCCRGKRSRYAVDEMPDLFNDLRQARRWWDVVQHYVIYQTQMHSALRFEDIQTPASTGRRSPDEKKKYSGILDRWRARFAPLKTQVLAEEASNEQAYLQLISLRLSCLSLDISVRSSQYTDGDVLESSTEDFRQLVSMSRIILEGQLPEHASDEVFTMDSSPSWSLLSVSIYCRDDSTRKEAHQLL